jgi:phenylacetate-CoA ligase
MRQYIEGKTGIKAYDIYGLSEIIGPGVGAACAAQQGLHIFEDHFMIEIVDPVTDEPMPDGEEGELIITTLSKKAMPVMRYRTHDITSVIAEPCSCGRSIRRINRIARRSDDMFIIRGVNVFPSQVEAALLKIDATLPHYQIVLSRHGGMDQMEVQVEVTAELFSDSVRELEMVHRQLSDAIAHVLGIRVKLTLVEPHTIARSQGKAKRVVDNRNL